MDLILGQTATGYWLLRVQEEVVAVIGPITSTVLVVAANATLSGIIICSAAHWSICAAQRIASSTIINKGYNVIMAQFVVSDAAAASTAARPVSVSVTVSRSILSSVYFHRRRSRPRRSGRNSTTATTSANRSSLVQVASGAIVVTAPVQAANVSVISFTVEAAITYLSNGNRGSQLGYC